MTERINPYQAGTTAPDRARGGPGAARLLVPAMSLITIAVQGYIVITLRPKYADFFARSGFELPAPTSVFLQIPTASWMAALFVAAMLTVMVELLVRSAKTKLVVHFLLGLMLLAIVVLSFAALRLPIATQMDTLQ